MKICICGSMAVMDQIEKLSARLCALGHHTALPCRGDAPSFATGIPGHDTIGVKALFVKDHLIKIRTSEAVLIANFPKGGRVGYIGTSTLMEAAMAYALGKQIYLMQKPECSILADELFAMRAIQLEGSLEMIGVELATVSSP